MIAEFNPAVAALGGVLIGLAAWALWHLNGRVAGVAGIVGGLIGPRQKETGWRLAFVAGLLGGGALLAWIAPGLIGAPGSASPALLVGAGVLVGFGARLGDGCTSGHGVCGIGRGSKRSVAATLTFMISGAIAVLAARHLLGAS
jgi:uncharacterized protein